MSDDSIRKIFDRLDNIGERIAGLEVMSKMIKQDIDQIKESLSDHGKRIGNLEQARAGAMSIKEFVAWGVAIVAVAWGVMKP